MIFSILTRVVQLRVHEFSVPMPSLQQTENIPNNCPSQGPAAPAYYLLKVARVSSSDME